METDEKKRTELFETQKKLLDTLLAHGAISAAQHDYSLTHLAEKMGLTNRLDGGTEEKDGM